MEFGNKQKTAYVNYGIIAVNVICFAFLELLGSTEDTRFMAAHGAMYGPLILSGGEYWRLVTAMFLHFGIEHLVNNMLVLFVLGDNLERALGKVKYILFYMICGVGANAISLVLNLPGGEYVVSAGASGAIFGVVGGLLYAVIRNRGRLEDLSTRQLVVMIGFSIYLGISSPDVDNAAHIAGLLIGIIMGFILYRKPKSCRVEEEIFYR